MWHGLPHGLLVSLIVVVRNLSFFFSAGYKHGEGDTYIAHSLRRFIEFLFYLYRMLFIVMFTKTKSVQEGIITVCVCVVSWYKLANALFFRDVEGWVVRCLFLCQALVPFTLIYKRGYCLHQSTHILSMHINLVSLLMFMKLEHKVFLQALLSYCRIAIKKGKYLNFIFTSIKMLQSWWCIIQGAVEQSCFLLFKSKIIKPTKTTL